MFFAELDARKGDWGVILVGVECLWGKSKAFRVVLEQLSKMYFWGEIDQRIWDWRE